MEKKLQRLQKMIRVLMEQMLADMISKKMVLCRSLDPSTLQIIKASDVYPPFFMILPSEFVREYLPKVKAKMTLWDRHGRPWEVSYLYHKSRGFGAFCHGWGEFVIGNNIEKDDICMFEIFQENNIRVGVFGVVQETTPCIPLPK